MQATGIVALIAHALLAPAAAAQFPVIELTAISARFGQVGTSLELRATSGNHLDQVNRLIFSDPRITAELLTAEPSGEAAETTASDAAKEGAKDNDGEKDAKGTPKWGHFRVSIPADLDTGRYEVRAVGAYGVSNPRAFCVTPDPVVELDSVSQDPGEPTLLDAPVGPEGSFVVNHQATAARIDYYRLSGSVKQSRRVNLHAQRIDSRMIAQLTLIGPDGRRLAADRGADGFDPSVTIPAGQIGEFTLAVHDFLFRGGENYFYGLRIENEEPRADPRVTHPNGSGGSLPAWDGLEAVSAVEHLDADSAGEVDSVASGSGIATLSPPGVVEASFDALHGDRVFEFDAEQGTRLTVEVVSHRLGQPSDPRLIIQRQESKPDGEVIWHAVANEDDPPVIGDAAMRLRSKDPIVSFTAPAPATYRIHVRNLDSGRSLADEPVFRLVLREPSPDYRLVAMFAHPHNDPAQARPRGCQLMRGDTQSIRVLAVRRDGFTGPIELSVQGLPAGLTCRGATIAANQSEAYLSVLASDDAETWTGEVEIIGKSLEGDDAVSSTAAAATVIWGSGEQRDFIRSRLATKLVMSVTDQQQTPVSIRLGGEEPASSQPGTNISVPIALSRRDGGGAPVILRPRNLPPGVTAGEVTVAGDKSEGTIELKIAAEAKPGNYSIWLQGETKVQFKPVTEAQPRELTVFLSSTTANIQLTASP